MVALSIVANLFLPLRWVVVGLAGAFAIAYFVSINVTLNRLGKRIGPLSGNGILRTHVRLAFASLAAMAPAYVIARILTSFLGKGALGSLISLTIAGPVFLAIYLFLARRLRVVEVNELFLRLRALAGRGMESA
jgi:putative peptidoglycan lipid II flippase